MTKISFIVWDNTLSILYIENLTISSSPKFTSVANRLGIVSNSNAALGEKVENTLPYSDHPLRPTPHKQCAGSSQSHSLAWQLGSSAKNLTHKILLRRLSKLTPRNCKITQVWSPDFDTLNASVKRGEPHDASAFYFSDLLPLQKNGNPPSQNMEYSGFSPYPLC